jgi:hypothetical protein
MTLHRMADIRRFYLFGSLPSASAGCGTLALTFTVFTHLLWKLSVFQFMQRYYSEAIYLSLLLTKLCLDIRYRYIYHKLSFSESPFVGGDIASSKGQASDRLACQGGRGASWRIERVSSSSLFLEKADFPCHGAMYLHAYSMIIWSRYFYSLSMTILFSNSSSTTSSCYALLIYSS